MTITLLVTTALLTAGLAPPASLTVDDCVRLALSDSPRLRAARFEARAAQVEVDRERPVARPTVSAQAVGTLQGPPLTFPRAGDGDAEVLPGRYGRVELTVEQPLYRAGASAARSLYGARTRATALSYARALNDAVLDTRRAYSSLVTAQAMSGVADGGVDLARRHLRLTRDMLQAGTASERDVKVAEADLAQAEQGALRAGNGVALARADLNRLLGRDPDAPLDVVKDLPVPLVPAASAEGIKMALERRPEVRELQESLAAARAGVSLAATQDRPALAARASAARQTPSAFVRADYYAASLVVTWSILDAGKTRADVRQARERVGQLEALLAEARHGVALEVEKAWRTMREARQRIEVADRGVAASRQALEISDLRYERRMATQLEVSGALLGLARAEADRVQAVSDLHAAAADYAHATGQDVPTALPSL